MKKYALIVIGFFLLHSCSVIKKAFHKKTAEEYFQMGKDEAGQTNFLVAIGHFTKAIEMNPNYIEAYKERASIDMVMDSIPNALRDYDSLLVKYKPTEYEKLGAVYLQKGDALYLYSQDTLACSCYRKAQSLNNSSSWDRIRKRCK